MLDQNKIEFEMAHTTWEESCKDPHVTEDNSLRECRRLKNHDGKHASGFNVSHKQW